MAGEEIKITKDRLNSLLLQLRLLQSHTQYYQHAKETQFSKSGGQSAAALDAQAAELAALEDTLLQLFQQTEQVIAQAGIKFDEADQMLKDAWQEIQAPYFPKELKLSLQNRKVQL